MKPLIEVARMLKLDYQSLWKAIARGEVAAVQVKGRWQVDPESAKQYRDRQPSPDAPGAPDASEEIA